ncbi:MinD/ParA family protein [Venenivibrio stagnispumantis]|uniref:Flagellar biosynthesis protein FlhG n=1 Tax=Venenivibrio stagnispumantis TaxID=407998 RepID=A0AA46AEM8_9AQUI|nr:MinD/ParA family protein [Venenivibrio stagnispumantis]MCW4572811.1 MinD/ParA family protein [Venenivibrio stagnispumantis]SMP13717.1 flagellar biosynthesis protein FlhG [Venenivibrio stagnispumantis]
MDEQLKHLKELVNNRAVNKNTKFISIASGKGGVGKTNIIANFAYILANSFNKKVLLIDADIGMANIHIILDLNVKKTLKDITYGEKIENIILNKYGFDILPGFSGIDSIFEFGDFDSFSFIKMLDKISSYYDYVLIDIGAGIDEKIANFVRASNKTYIVTTPEPTALVDAYAFIKSIYKSYGYKDFKVIINMVENKQEAEEIFFSLNNSLSRFLDITVQLAGYLPFSKLIQESVLNKTLITAEYPSDKFSIQLTNIVANEIGEKPPKEKSSFWEKFYSFIKRS